MIGTTEYSYSDKTSMTDYLRSVFHVFIARDSMPVTRKNSEVSHTPIPDRFESQTE